MNVAPNYNNGYINVNAEISENSFYQLMVYDASGKQVYSGEHYTESGMTEDRVQVYSQATGIYIVKIVVNGQLMSDKVLWQ